MMTMMIITTLTLSLTRMLSADNNDKVGLPPRPDPVCTYWIISRVSAVGNLHGHADQCV